MVARRMAKSALLASMGTVLSSAVLVQHADDDTASLRREDEISDKATSGYTEEDESFYTPAFITPLQRPMDRVSLSEGLGSLGAGTASGLQYASVSQTQLDALRKARKEADELRKKRDAHDKKKKHNGNKEGDEDDEAGDIPKTLLTSLAATEYVGTIGVGTVHEPKGCDKDKSLLESGECKAVEQQQLKVVFDTGSTNLWMASTLCKQGPCVSGNRQRYNPFIKEGGSETFADADPPRNLTINFATATLIGPMGNDQFHIGPFTVKDQSFGLIEEEQGNTFAELPLEGIVGLAFPSMSAGGVRAFFDTVIQQKVLPKNLFAFYLSPIDQHSSFLQNNGHNQAVQYKVGMDAILWGGVDKRLYEGELLWFPVSQAHYWALDLYGFWIGNDSMNFTKDDAKQEGGRKGKESKKGASLSEQSEGDEKPRAKLIVDSGTAYYTAEEYLYHGIMNKMVCGNGNERAPDLTYRLKDINGKMHNLVLSHEDYMVAQCEPGFVQIPVPQQYGPAMLLGELFMRKYFTVFDRGDGSDDKARVGFARSKPGAESSQQLDDTAGKKESKDSKN